MIASKNCSPEEALMVKQFLEGYFQIKVPGLAGLECQLYGLLLEPGQIKYIAPAPPLEKLYGALTIIRGHAEHIRSRVEFKKCKTLFDLLHSFATTRVLIGTIYSDGILVHPKSLDFLKKWDRKARAGKKKLM